MKGRVSQTHTGFTLIEIVLVLAIAGLIMVIVLLAVSGAQRSRRDTQRKRDLARIASQLEQYASNNQETYPKSAVTLAAFNSTYLTPVTNWTDPSSGSTYTPQYRVTATVLGPGVVDYHEGKICSNGTMAPGSGGGYALVMGLEQGANACVDNH